MCRVTAKALSEEVFLCLKINGLILDGKKNV